MIYKKQKNLRHKIWRAHAGSPFILKFSLVFVMLYMTIVINTIEPPNRDKIPGISPTARNTQIGLRIGSMVAMIELLTAEVFFIPNEKSIYGTPSCNVPIRNMTVQLIVLNVRKFLSKNKKGNKNILNKLPSREASTGLALGNLLAKNTPAKLTPERRPIKSPSQYPA